MGFYSWSRPITWSLIEMVTLEALILYLAQSKWVIRKNIKHSLMLIAKRIKDLHSPDTQVCSLTLYSLWMPYIPIGVLEPFLLVLNPVKASAKVFVSLQTRISSILGSAGVKLYNCLPYINILEIVFSYILKSWNVNL